jgi:plastocyanin
MSDENPGPPYGPSGGNVVSVYRGGFNPSEISVDAGIIITWTNKDSGPQSVTSDAGLFDGIIGSNGSYSYRFSTSGTYQYFNRINPDATGKIVVN